MIKLIGMDGWIGSIGLTENGKREVVRITRSALERIVSLKRGEIGIVSVAALRRMGTDAGFYYSLGGDIDMWLSPMEDDTDGKCSVSARLKDMYTRQGVRVNMHVLFRLIDIAGMIGLDKVRVVAKGGYWTLVENATCRAIVKEKDVALEIASLTQEIGNYHFETRDVKRVLDNVRESNPFYEQWDINGNGDVRMWIGADGMLLGDDRENAGRIAYSYKSGNPVSLTDATSADEWMERYTVWEEAMRLIANGGKGVLWDNGIPLREFVETEYRELGVDWP